jgi:uncharacterized protein (TIGR02145 family)
MRRLNFLFFFFLTFLSLYGQTPASFAYQAVVRAPGGEVIADTTVGLKLTILRDSVNGSAVYSETHSPRTDATGLMSVELGVGIASLGQFSSIDWKSGPYFVKSEIDPLGGATYTLSGTTPILSVPYALYADSSQLVSQAESASNIQVRVSGDSLYIGDSIAVVIPGMKNLYTVYRPGIVHCDSNAITEIVPVTSPTSGHIWMDRNLGASRAATASNDADAYGDVFQWGRFADGHQCRATTFSGNVTSQATTFSPDSTQAWYGKFIVGFDDWLATPNDSLWTGINGTNNPCPTYYRLPTEAEWSQELNTSDQTPVISDSVDAINSFLKLPMGGQAQSSDGQIQSDGSSGYYWSSTLSTNQKIRRLFFSSDTATTSDSKRADGNSVRCIQE